MEIVMKHQERKGSAITSIIAAILFALILAIFGRSVEGGAKKDYSQVVKSTAPMSKSQVIGSGLYQINVLEEAKHHFMPVLRDLE